MCECVGNFRSCMGSQLYAAWLAGDDYVHKPQTRTHNIFLLLLLDRLVPASFVFFSLPHIISISYYVLFITWHQICFKISRIFRIKRGNDYLGRHIFFYRWVLDNYKNVLIRIDAFAGYFAFTTTADMRSKLCTCVDSVYVFLTCVVPETPNTRMSRKGFGDVW